MTKLITASVAALTAALSLASAAAAQETVRYGDLDLGTQAGIEHLERRVRLAAGRACVSEGGMGLARLNGVACERGFRNEAMRAMPIARREQIAATRGAGVMVSAR